jgi:hypothetical protein
MRKKPTLACHLAAWPYDLSFYSPRTWADSLLLLLFLLLQHLQPSGRLPLPRLLAAMQERA